MSIDAFDFAEKFQTPVFVMTDLDLGMNNWMADPFAYPEKPIARGKVLDRRRPRPAGRLRPLQRRGWRWRRLPHSARHQSSRRRRTSRAAAATTKRPNTPSAKTITSTTWIAWRTSSKSCASFVPAAGGDTIAEGARIGFVAIGTSDYAVRESCDQLARRIRDRRQLPAPQGVSVHPALAGLHPAPRPRLRGGPEPRRRSCWGSCAWNSTPDLIAKLRSLRYYGGLPLDARTVTDEIIRQEGK